VNNTLVLERKRLNSRCYRIFHSVFLGAILLGASSVISASASQTAKYQLWPCVINATGNTLASFEHRLHNSIGQVYSGYSSTASYSLQTGFLNDYEATALIPVSATPTPVPTATPIPVPSVFFKAYQNKINPNRCEQVILRWAQPQAGAVTITIFNMLGDKVITLVNQKSYSSGQYHEIYWKGDTKNGAVAGSGIYLAIIEAPGFKAKTKAAIVK